VERSGGGGLVLVLVQLRNRRVHHEIPNESRCHEDKHKAPILPCIRPLSLQDEGERFLSFPYSFVKFIRTEQGKWITSGGPGGEG
jgi:hypothetical protein